MTLSDSARSRTRSLSRDDLPAVRAPRLRAAGAITPDMATTTIHFGDVERTVGLAHTKLMYGGGWSYFVCPQCGRRCRVLRLTAEGKAACWRCDGLLYRCQQHDRTLTIAKLKAQLWGPRPARHNRPQLEAALSRLMIQERRARLRLALAEQGKFGLRSMTK
jgi:hypothetical protein